eukprot:6490847-Amphidinium_carterae.3
MTENRHKIPAAVAGIAASGVFPFKLCCARFLALADNDHSCMTSMTTRHEVRGAHEHHACSATRWSSAAGMYAKAVLKR